MTQLLRVESEHTKSLFFAAEFNLNFQMFVCLLITLVLLNFNDSANGCVCSEMTRKEVYDMSDFGKSNFKNYHWFLIL